MDLGEDLSIDMLGEESLEDNFVIEGNGLAENLDGTAPIKPEDKEKDKEKIISEEAKTPESVAEKDKGTPEEAKPSPEAGNTAIYSSLATHLRDTGVLPSLDIKETKIENVSDLQNAIKAEIDNAKDESVKAYEEAIKRGEPEDAYVKYVNTQKQYDAITDEVLNDTGSADLRFNIIAQNFLNKNFSKEDAIKYAKRSQELGEDVEDASKALNELKEYNKTSYQQQVDSKAAEEKAAIDKINEFIKNTDEIIPGVKLTQATKDNLFKQMSTAVGRDSNGNPISEYGDALVKEPVKTKAITEYLFLVTKGFTDFSNMTNLISSKAANDFDKILKSSGADFLNVGKSGPVKDDNQSFSINDEFTLDV